MKSDPDQWKYLSLVTDNCHTYDFKFRSRADVTEFVIAISHACSLLQGCNFVGVTNRSFVTILLIKAKLRRIAKNIKTNVAGLFARAIFLTVQERFSEGNFYEKKIKYETLTFLIGTCMSCSCRLK